MRKTIRSAPIRLLAGGLLAAAAVSASAAGDPAHGQKINSLCVGCHGIEGWRTAYPDVYHVPKLGGQHAAYIVKALKEYQAGERNFQTMHAVAASLSEQDMEDLAAYYAGGADK